MLSNKKGTVQSVVVITVSVVTLLILAVIITSYVKTQINLRAENKKLTQEIAEEGMQMALKKISENPSWTEGFSNVKCSAGFYNIRIDKANDSTFKAVATGFIGNVKTTLICTYKLEQDSGSIKPKPLSWEYL
jgi:hypothetical protein